MDHKSGGKVSVLGTFGDFRDIGLGVNAMNVMFITGRLLLQTTGLLVFDPAGSRVGIKVMPESGEP